VKGWYDTEAITYPATSRHRHHTKSFGSILQAQEQLLRLPYAMTQARAGQRGGLASGSRKDTGRISVELDQSHYRH